MNKLLTWLLATLTTTAFAQELPKSLTVTMNQFKMTVGKHTETHDPIPACYNIQKMGNTVFIIECGASEVSRSIEILEVQKERKVADIYIIQYFGRESTNAIGYVDVFLTYTFDYQTHKWAVLIEAILDEPRVPLWRQLSKYFNL